MKCSTDYHDYVFRDGKLVGEFDRMYIHSSEVPWHQDRNALAVFSDIDIAILRQFTYDSICDIGCGLGFFTVRLYRELTFEKERGITGIDISETAVNEASRNFPEIQFVTGNLLKENPLPGKLFGLIVIKEVIWYVCQDISLFLDNVSKMIKKDGYIYISQAFPDLKKPFVGNEILPSPKALEAILSERFESITSNILNRPILPEEGPFLQLLGKKRP